MITSPTPCAERAPPRPPTPYAIFSFIFCLLIVFAARASNSPLLSFFKYSSLNSLFSISLEFFIEYFALSSAIRCWYPFMVIRDNFLRPSPPARDPAKRRPPAARAAIPPDPITTPSPMVLRTENLILLFNFLLFSGFSYQILNFLHANPILGFFKRSPSNFINRDSSFLICSCFITNL